MWYFSLLFLTAVKDHAQFFLADFQWNILRDSININNFNCNPVVLKKKIGKTSKSCYFWAQLAHKKGVSMAHAKEQKEMCRNNKSRSSAFKNILFYKYIIVLAVLWIFSWVVWWFLAKKGHFQLKLLWDTETKFGPN